VKNTAESPANCQLRTANRIAALDSFRGLTVASMLLVNNPGTWSAIWWPLRHAEWHGCTPTDLIFPFFLFIVGITTELSRKEPVGILKRGALIILFGLLLHAFPYFKLDTLRWFGVLQRIGIVYIVAALIAWKASRRTIVVITAVILLGYWAILTQGVLEPAEDTIAAQVDRALIPEAHIWKSSKTWDPEGPLSTIPAVATALLGVLAARAVKEKKIKLLTIAGVIGIAAGFGWGFLFPINKSLWTSSYVIYTAGWACVILALWMWKGPVRPFNVFGVNPLIAFVGSGMMARLLGILKIDGVSLQQLSYRTLYKPFFPPQLASFLWALTFVGIWWAILALLYRRNIVLKV
jgi:predicted acyltransferase